MGQGCGAQAALCWLNAGQGDCAGIFTCTGATHRLLTYRLACELQARKLESELDVKVAAYGKLCNGYEYTYTKGESGLAQEQVG